MSTADAIVDTTEALIQDRGYFGFSFADIAERVGIKKASIYYYFPAKAALGRAVIVRYRERMRAISDQLELSGSIDHWQALDRYVSPILEMGRNPSTACLCGVLGGEYTALPDEMKQEIAAFFQEHLTWVEDLLVVGKAAGSFQFNGEPRAMARLIFSAIEGSLLIKRTSGDIEFVDDVLGQIKLLLGAV